MAVLAAQCTPISATRVRFLCRRCVLVLGSNRGPMDGLCLPARRRHSPSQRPHSTHLREGPTVACTAARLLTLLCVSQARSAWTSFVRDDGQVAYLVLCVVGHILLTAQTRVSGGC